MKKREAPQRRISILYLVIVLCVIIVINAALQQPTRTRSKAAESVGTVQGTITYPEWGTRYRAHDRAQVDVSVVHTYPVERIVFKILEGSTRRSVCTDTTSPYSCIYTVPDTQKSEADAETGSAYTIEVHTYDTVGNTDVDSLQLWTHR
jgi:hypothetical protein